MRRLPALALGLVGCTAPTKPARDTAFAVDSGAVDTAVAGDSAAPDSGVVDTGEPDDDGLFGDPIDPPRPPPDFLATNQHGAPRSPDWFTGDPSVLWFFRDTGAT